MPRPAFYLSNGRPIVPDPRMADMSIDELSDAASLLVAAIHAAHTRACLESHTRNGALRAWAEDLVTELSVELDRLVIEFESRRPADLDEAIVRDAAIAAALPHIHVVAQLGLEIQILRGRVA